MVYRQKYSFNRVEYQFDWPPAVLSDRSVFYHVIKKGTVDDMLSVILDSVKLQSGNGAPVVAYPVTEPIPRNEGFIHELQRVYWQGAERINEKRYTGYDEAYVDYFDRLVVFVKEISKVQAFDVIPNITSVDIYSKEFIEEVQSKIKRIAETPAETGVSGYFNDVIANDTQRGGEKRMTLHEWMEDVHLNEYPDGWYRG